MIERHLTRLRARHALSEAEEAAVRSLIASTRTVGARTAVIRDRARLDHSTLLLDGLMCRAKDLSDGERQITELHVAGDFADMHSFTLKRLDHQVHTLTECTIGIAPHERVHALTERHPRLARIYWFSTNLDAAIHREWELSLGKRDAAQRLAALFCEMHVRLGLVGLADANGFQLRLTQAELGECVGLTPVHVNRTLKQLREDGLVSFQNWRVELPDIAALRAAADWSDGYLYLDAEPL